jgi:hypothetical protein
MLTVSSCIIAGTFFILKEIEEAKTIKPSG